MAHDETRPTRSTPHARSAFAKDVLRTISHSKKRFVSIAIICALGVTMLTGLAVACIDLRESADELFDEQHLFDISVQSTLGLTDNDVRELASIEGVASAEGTWEESTYTRVNGHRASVDVKALSATGINAPYVLEGTLPQSADEVAVTAQYLKDSGKSIGDTLTIEDVANEDDASDSAIADIDTAGTSTEIFTRRTYTITASAIDPTNITAPEGPVAFRASTSADYAFFVTDDAVIDQSVFTAIYLKVEGTDELMTYSDAYSDAVDEVVARIDKITPQRERARAEEIKADANAQIDDAEAEAEQELSDAEQELDNAQAELDEGRAEVADGQRELNDQRADALAQLDDAQATIDAAWAEIVQGEEEAQSGLAGISEGRALLDQQAQQLDTVESGKQQAEDGVALAQSYYDAAQQLGQETVALFGSEAVSAAWNDLASWTGTEEPVALQQAFVDAACARSNDIALQYEDMKQQPGISDLLDQRNTITARIEQIDGRLTAISDRTAEIEARLVEIDTALTSPTIDDSEKQALESESQQLSQEQTELSNEQSALAAERGQLDATLAALNAQLADFDSLAALAEALSQLTAGETSKISQLASGMGRATMGLAQAQQGLALANRYYELIGGAEGVAAARQKISAARAELDALETTINDNLAKLPSAKSDLVVGQAELDAQRADALAQLEDAQRQLDDALAEIADGQAELDEGRATFEQERDDAYAQIADARAEVDDIGNATWYVQDRSNLGGYASVDSDTGSIDAIARVIPVIFFIVAVLVSLTTATRMVEEERTLIGLYKALGYSRARILSKYLIYTLSAALIGGIIGDLLGFIALPMFLFTIFNVMYQLPILSLHFNAFYAFGSIALFVLGIVGATFLTCRADLKETPAALMRPKAPRAGSRIFLEHIGPLWHRMGFLNKVTARNLFRYKRRLLMTVFGIMGCTALLICGFAIKDTVASFSPRQYGITGTDVENAQQTDTGVYRYGLMAVANTDDYDQAQSLLENEPLVRDMLPVYLDTVTVQNGDAKKDMQLIVVPEGLSIADYVNLVSPDGSTVELPGSGVVITNNAATVLGFSAGDVIELKDSSLNQAGAYVDAIATNYLGNAVFCTQSAYEELLGALEPNGFLVHLDGTAAEQIELTDRLSTEDVFLSVTGTEQLALDFSESFTLINSVVYVVILLAAGLAFVVLFTLSTVNIAEREREVATIKVLGFRQGEVRRYINKETLVLTAMGIALGIPVGWALGKSFEFILKMPDINFAVVIEPISFVISAALTIVFALVVNLITNRMLDRVNMVEALKSAE